MGSEMCIRDRVKNNCKSAAAGELLDRLRRRPNWVNYLLEARNHPELNLEHLAKLITEKSSKVPLVLFDIAFNLYNHCNDDSNNHHHRH